LQLFNVLASSESFSIDRVFVDCVAFAAWPEAWPWLDPLSDVSGTSILAAGMTASISANRALLRL